MGSEITPRLRGIEMFMKRVEVVVYFGEIRV